MSLRKYLVLTLMIVFNAFGDVTLAHGMKKVGAISAARLADALSAVFTPWVLLGILLLLCFFACYLTALSWADLRSEERRVGKECRL